MQPGGPKIVGLKNIAGAQIDPATDGSIVALPAAITTQQFNAVVWMIQEMLQAMQPLMNADTSNRQRINAESCTLISGSTTAITGAIGTAIGTVRVEEAGGFGLRNIAESSELRRETMDVAFNTQLSQLIFS